MIAIDTSVAVPLLARNHHEHERVVDWWDGRDIAIPQHALAETYSVLTRLPGDLRLTAGDAARLLSARFPEPLMLADDTSRRLPTILADRDVAGGAVYDAMVALAALEHEYPLATRDARAKATYDALGVRVDTVV